MAITEAVTAKRPTTPTVSVDTDPAPASGAGRRARARASASASASAEKTVYRPIPIWFFTFEGLIGASYDVVKTSPHAWIVLALAGVTNLALARTVLRGRLKMAKAMIRGRRTRKLAVGLIGLRVGVHFALGLVGVRATTQTAHLAFAALMCATTVALLAFDQRVMLRALNSR
jgi:hypothetical protein